MGFLQKSLRLSKIPISKEKSLKKSLEPGCSKQCFTERPATTESAA